MASAQGIKAGSAFIELLVSDEQLVKGLSKASKKLKAFGEGISGLGTKLTGIGTVVTTALVGFAKVFASGSKELLTMKQRTGISVAALSELGYAAELSGTDMESLEVGIKKMQKTIGQAAKGSATATEALAQLGLTVEDLKGLSPDQQFKLIADKLAAIKSPAIRAAMAMQIFGRQGTQLLPMLTQGSAGIEAMQEEARRLGLTASATGVILGVKLEEALVTLWKVLKKLGTTIGSAIAPLLTQLTNQMIDIVVRAIAWVKKNQEVVVTILKISVAAIGAGAALMLLGKAIIFLSKVAGAMSVIIDVVSTVFGFLSVVIPAVISAIFTLSAAVISTCGVIIAGIVGTAGVAMGVVATACGIIGSVVGAAVAGIVGSIGVVAGVVSSAFGILGSIAGAVLSPLVLITIGILAVGAALLYVFDKGGGIVTWMGKVLSNLADIAKSVFAIIRVSANTLWMSIQTLGLQAVHALEKVWTGFSGVFVAVVRGVVSVAQRIWSIFGNKLVAVWKFAVGKLVEAWAEFRGALSKPLAVIQQVALAFWSNLKDIWASGISSIQSAWASVSSFVVGIFHNVVSGLKVVWNAAWSVMLVPIGWIKSAIGGIGWALSALANSGGKAIAWLGARFNDLKAFATEAFGGIADALAAGDIALAANILWLTLKVAWIKGVQLLKSAWLNFRGFMIKIAYDAFYGVQAAWEIVGNALMVAWIELTAFASKIWLKITSSFSKAWNTAITWVEKRIHDLHGLMDSSFDSETAKKMADQNLAADNSKIDQQTNAAMAEREKKRADERASAQQIHDQNLASIGQESSDKEKSLDDEYAKKMQESQDELDKAKQAWKDAIVEARMEKYMKESQGTDRLGAPPAIPDYLEGLGPTLEAQQKTIGVRGTFNALEAPGLGAGGVTDRIAKASEETAKHTKKLVEQNRDSGEEFD